MKGLKLVPFVDAPLLLPSGALAERSYLSRHPPSCARAKVQTVCLLRVPGAVGVPGLRWLSADRARQLLLTSMPPILLREQVADLEDPALCPAPWEMGQGAQDGQRCALPFALTSCSHASWNEETLLFSPPFYRRGN